MASGHAAIQQPPKANRRTRLFNKPAFRSHAENMVALHAAEHPDCGCMGANAVHMCHLSHAFTHVCTRYGHFCVQDYFRKQTKKELDLTDVNL